MGMKSKSDATPTPAPVTQPRAIEPKTAPRTEVKGQVAMHAIIAGYKVASHMAATIANGPGQIKETLHALAAEVAAKIEAYTFKGD